MVDRHQLSLASRQQIAHLGIADRNYPKQSIDSLLPQGFVGLLRRHGNGGQVGFGEVKVGRNIPKQSIRAAALGHEGNAFAFEIAKAVNVRVSADNQMEHFWEEEGNGTDGGLGRGVALDDRQLCLILFYQGLVF